MKKLKLMTIVGTRPEIIKMSAIMKKCDEYFDHIIVHTGQNYDYTLNQVFFEELDLREPDYYLGVVGENLGQTMGNVLAKSYELMVNGKHVVSVSDVFLNRNDAEALVQRCNLHKLSLVHLADVIEDAIAH